MGFSLVFHVMICSFPGEASQRGESTVTAHDAREAQARWIERFRLGPGRVGEEGQGGDGPIAHGCQLG